MSAGSAASNLGYSNITPNSNINGNFINKDNSHYPGGFGSNQIPGLPGLAGAKYNVDAAAARVPGICMSGGGKKRKIKRKIKNITKRYRMTKKSMKRKASSMKRRIKATLSRALGRTRAVSLSRARSVAGGKKSRTKRRRGGNPFMAFRLGSKLFGKKNESPENKPQEGGYSQYQNNMPMTQTYSTGGVLSAANLGLANPVPYKVLSNEANCVDNYNHFVGKGFPSRGH
jgi:hypothetical protein